LAFVGDVTPIATSTAKNGKTKHIPNPNVLIELGYAKKSLTPLRVIQVWNTAFTSCGPEDLPFDMRGRRGPFSFALPEEADKPAREAVVARLAKQLKGALEPIVLRSSVRPQQEQWAESDSDDISIWPSENGQFLVNEPDHGSGTKFVFPPPRSFVRVLPSGWSGSDDLDRHDILLDMGGNGFSWGATIGGVLTYPGSVLYPDTSKVHAVTKRFEGTGEVWATRTDIAAKYGEYLCVRGDAIPKDWFKYLAYALPHIRRGGGQLPFKVRLGVVGLQGHHWPNGNEREKPHAALQATFTRDFTISAGTIDELWQSVLDVWVAYRKVFSLPYPSMPEQQAMKHFINQVVGQSLQS
jgi:hypothetical protein